MCMWLNLHFYLLTQTWWEEEEDKEEGANERGKQHQGCRIQVKLWIHTRHRAV